MKTLTVEEAVAGLGRWLDRALAGEQIQIRKRDAVVELRPTRLPIRHGGSVGAARGATAFAGGRTVETGGGGARSPRGARGTSGGGGSPFGMIHLDTNYLIGLVVKASSQAAWLTV